jgi:uncharacterized repeat protein (TIGR03803 family)
MTHRQCAPATAGTLFLALLTFSSYIAAQAPPAPTTLYSFIGGSDGAVPMGNLAITGGPSGPSALYGATDSYPSTVFALTPPVSGDGPWNYAVLWQFTGSPSNGGDGYRPMGGVVVGSGGVLYGTTSNGGSGTGNCSLACGTVFSLTPPASPGGAWSLAMLYSFMNVPDGAYPSASLAIGPGGVLYGTTTLGGVSNFGTVFSLTPPLSPGGAWSETVLHSFTGGRYGADPKGALAIGPDGALYGTTSDGESTQDCGTVFTLRPPASPGGAWQEGTVYTFACAPDGSHPRAGVEMGGGGVLYGTTTSGGTGTCDEGCGTVFSLAPPAIQGGSWTETVLHSFGGNSDGASPTNAGVAIGNGGVLYGTTLRGGISPTCCGTVFSLTPPAAPGGAWTETSLGLAGLPDAGASPWAGLAIGPDGILYGTTTEGGARNNGAIFSWRP